MLYPTSTSATRLSGYAFDTCSAPPLATMQAWKAASPYQGVGTYIGGVQEVMVEGYNKATGQWIGRTSQNKTLNFAAASEESLIGRYLPVRVTRAGPNSLVGDWIN